MEEPVRYDCSFCFLICRDLFETLAYFYFYVFRRDRGATAANVLLILSAITAKSRGINVRAGRARTVAGATWFWTASCVNVHRSSVANGVRWDRPENFHLSRFCFQVAKHSYNRLGWFCGLVFLCILAALSLTLSPIFNCFLVSGSGKMTWPKVIQLSSWELLKTTLKVFKKPNVKDGKYGWENLDCFPFLFSQSTFGFPYVTFAMFP